MQQWSVSALCAGCTPARTDASLAVQGRHIFLYGGKNEVGAATNTLYMLDLGALAQGHGWTLVDCAGEGPSSRWGHSSFIYQQQLWVYGGFDGQDVHDGLFSLDLNTWTWKQVQQGGSRPNRRLGKFKTFHTTVLSPAGHSMLAFGMDSQDGENSDPSKPASSPALRLYAFDLDQHKWSAVHVAGCVTFQKLEALQCCSGKLVAVGWSPATAKSDMSMQVCCLDLTGLPSCRTPSFTFGATRSRPTPCWQHVETQGMLPSARTSAASAALGNQLLLHGGMLCCKSVAGRLAADTFCLDLSTCTWTRLAPSQERAVGSSSINVPRAGHRAAAVPGHAAVVITGGTSSRQAFASCTTMECLRWIGGQPKATNSPSEESTAAGDASAAAVDDVNAMLSATPTLLGIQPFGHVTNTPKFIRQCQGAATEPGVTASLNTTTATPAAGRLPAATPAIKASSNLGSSMQAAAAAAAAAAPSAALQPRFDFSRFCFSDTLADVELVAGGRVFLAHRLLLCAQSPRLEQLILGQADQGSCSRSRSREPGAECRWTLHLQDIYPDILALMLQYMYCSLKVIPVEAAPLLFKAADRYGLEGLRAAALKVVIATLDLDNVCGNVLLAHDHKCSELSQACILFVAASPERFHQVLATPGYLDLTQSHPRVGTAFVQAVTQLLMGTRA